MDVRWSIAIAGFFAAIVSMSLEASPQSRALIEQGVAAMKTGDLKGALDQFDAAVRADAADLNALFFQGAALNRLGRGAEAGQKLAAAQKGGLKRVDLHLETGYAYVLTAKWADAITRLQRYETLQPGKGFTQELLGRAYMGSGNLDEARKALMLAAQRDPALKPTTELYLASIAARQGNRKEVDDRVAGILRDAPDSNAGRIVR